MTFKEKLQSMTAKEIIMAMVNSLIPPPLINIDMSTFGEAYTLPAVKFLGITLKKEKKVCFGCAATNTICRISGVTFTPDNIEGVTNRAFAIQTDVMFLQKFEYAINFLRMGNIWEYNGYAEGHFATIKYSGEYLPKLGSAYTKEDLQWYKQLADHQEVS